MQQQRCWCDELPDCFLAVHSLYAPTRQLLLHPCCDFVTVPRTLAPCLGVACPFANNTLRSLAVCVNNVPCPPRDCVGSWVPGNCSGACGGGEGMLLEEYVITVTAAYNGKAL